ncbi:MAG: acetate/propionate family kinase [Chloroflexi bacterium]|nr:acetate/propionate family kinase [Chloroflexota bacterium]
MRVLVLNAGSRTTKASLVDGGEALARAEGLTLDDPAALDDLLQGLGPDLRPDAVVYRFVHGGTRFTAPVVVDDAVAGELETLVALAPLHQPPALRALEAARARFPDEPQVCCFDTAFHASLPEAEWRYPVPWDWADRWGVRRFGFHGLSVEWSVGEASRRLGRPVADLCLVVAHLGGGCSVTAVEGGRSVRTSMGVTPLEGLMMTTRSGSIDPGAMLRLLADGALSADGMSEVLEHRSGLLGVSGVSADLREVQAAAEDGDTRAALAIEMFVARASAAIGAAAVALPRLDAVVFTGGIGEHAGAVRASIVERLTVLGGPTVLVVEAREDLVMAAQAERLLGDAIAS